jgi:lipopolysaccharide transport system permease protein
MKIYSSKFRSNLGIFKSIKIFFAEIKAYKKYIVSSVYNDIVAKYKQDKLGLLWSIILPIVPMSIYILLATIKAFKSSDNMPHIFYIAVGMTVWLLMSEIMVTTMKSIKKNKTILLKSNFPFSVVYVSSLGELLLNVFVRVVVVVFIMIYFSIQVSIINIVLFILSLVPILIFAFSSGIILSFLDTYIPDTKRLLDMFLRYGLFLSSVIFPFPTTGFLGELNNFNIFNTFIVASREILYFGYTNMLNLYCVYSFISFILFIIAIQFTLRLEFRIRAYL